MRNQVLVQNFDGDGGDRKYRREMHMMTTDHWPSGRFFSDESNFYIQDNKNSLKPKKFQVQNTFYFQKLYKS